MVVVDSDNFRGYFMISFGSGSGSGSSSACLFQCFVVPFLSAISHVMCSQLFPSSKLPNWQGLTREVESYHRFISKFIHDIVQQFYLLHTTYSI
jgi:hypothetical protein